MESALRPRDIQARIRAGESPEEVAAAAQTSVDAIMPFAAPVLAERAHVAQTRRSPRSAPCPSSPPPVARTLGEVADPRGGLGARRRRRVGRLATRDGALGAGGPVLRWPAPKAPREFTYDLPGRYVVAENDEARALTGECACSARTPAAAPAQARRLSAVPAQDELPLGDDAIELVRDPAPSGPGV